MQTDNWILSTEEFNELKRIIRLYIPLGYEYSQCHVGICSLEECVRCQDAIRIRELMMKLT